MADALSLPSIQSNPHFPPLPRAQPNPPPSFSDLPPASIPPPPDPPPTQPTLPLTTSSEPLPRVRWTTLFASKPRSAGDFSPPTINLKYSGKSLIPSQDIVQASIDVCQDYIAGFFLDAPLSFTAVVSHLNRHWSPRGPIKIKSNGQMFFFLFLESEDRKRVLEADPLVIRNKVFILKKWNVNMGNTGKEVKQVPIWIKMSNLPMVAWSKIGICWLATHIGKFLCMDRATESLDWLSYAKVMVEITPESELQNNFTVLLEDGTEHMIVVDYFWKPAVCQACNIFGHSLDNCPCSPYDSKVKNNRDGGNEQGEKSKSRNGKEARKISVEHVGTQIQDGIDCHNAKQTKVMSNANLANPRAPPVSTQEWQKVDGKKVSKGKAVAQTAAVVMTRNCFASLDNQSNEFDAQLRPHDTEEGEICEATKDNEMGLHNDNAGSKENLMKSISSQNMEFKNAVNAGEIDVNVPLSISTAHTNTECNFRPGFLNPVKPLKAGENPMQTLLYEVSNFGKVQNRSGSPVHSTSSPSGLSASVIDKENEIDATPCNIVTKNTPDARNIVGNLVGFLENNGKQNGNNEQGETQSDTTDLRPDAQELDQNLDGSLTNNHSSDGPKSISPAVKMKAKKVHKIKTVLELIESLRAEVDSGDFSEDVCEGKRQVIASLMRNYKDDLNKPSGPYDNIPPPPGFKAPPPEIGEDSAAAAPTTSALCKYGKSPVTRSTMRAMKNAVFDNG